MAVDFEREKCWWNGKAHREMQDLSDEVVNRALRWRKIERHLNGVRTILEIGGATGTFSIPLAKRGYNVTHLDFSPAMLEVARLNADGVTNIDFVEANAVDMSCFPDQWHRDQFPENAQLVPTYLGTLEAFDATQLRQILQSLGMEVTRCGGLGSLVLLAGPESLKIALADDTVFEKYLDLCERFDLEVLQDGPGTARRAGLIAVAKRAAMAAPGQ